MKAFIIAASLIVYLVYTLISSNNEAIRVLNSLINQIIG